MVPPLALKENLETTRMSDSQIVQTIQSFPRWHYEFDLRGHKTPIFNAGWVNRHRQRKAHIFSQLVDLCSGSLAGKRVLDLGCNAGYWSLCAIEAGCDYVLGIEGRQMHVDQAHFVFKANGIERKRYDFQCANVLEALSPELGPFDIILCFGLLYHVNRHIDLIDRMAAINDDLLIIDTSLSTRRGSILEIRHEPLDNPTHAVDYELVMWPTRTALIDMMRQFGYQTAVLKPQFTDYTCAEDYQEGSRRVFVCAKSSRLDRLVVECHKEDSIRKDLAAVRAWDLTSALIDKVLRRFERARQK
jgi:tRNA (mo5U34)-methyltransferase